MSEYDKELRLVSGDADVAQQDGSPELSATEERYLERGGDISETDLEQLRRDYGFSQPQPQERKVEFRPEVRDYVERLINHSNEQTLRAERLDERNRMLIEALEPQQQDHAWSKPQERPDPNIDIFATMEFDRQETARVRDRLDARERQEAHQRNEQAVIAHYQASMDRRLAADPEFYQGYQGWIATRYGELMARRYPDATPQQVYTAVAQGRIPPDFVRQVQSEERQLIQEALARRQDPAEYIESRMVARGFERVSVRQQRAEQQRQAEARQRAAKQQHEANEEAWFQKVARRIATSPGMSYEDALHDALPYRADRVRYREIKAKRQERSWPGSTTAISRGAW